MLFISPNPESNFDEFSVTFEVCDNWLLLSKFAGLYFIQKKSFFLRHSHKPEFIFCGSAVTGEDYSCESVAGWGLHRKNEKTSRPASGLFVLSVWCFRSKSILGNFILFLRSRRASLLVLVLWICRFSWPRQIIICRIQ